MLGKINIALAERELVCYAAPPKPDAEDDPKAVTGAEEREMETAIGVFASRDHAEKAVKELRERGVPEDSIVFLTRSETDAKTIAKEFGAYLGGFVGGAAGMTIPWSPIRICSGLLERVRAARDVS